MPLEKLIFYFLRVFLFLCVGVFVELLVLLDRKPGSFHGTAIDI